MNLLWERDTRSTFSNNLPYTFSVSCVRALVPDYLFFSKKYLSGAEYVREINKYIFLFLSPSIHLFYNLSGYIFVSPIAS